MSEVLKRDIPVFLASLIGAVALSGCGEKSPELLLDHCYQNLEHPVEIDCGTFYGMMPIAEGGYWVTP